MKKKLLFITMLIVALNYKSTFSNALDDYYSQAYPWIGTSEFINQQILDSNKMINYAPEYMKSCGYMQNIGNAGNPNYVVFNVNNQVLSNSLVCMDVDNDGYWEFHWTDENGKLKFATDIGTYKINNYGFILDNNGVVSKFDKSTGILLQGGSYQANNSNANNTFKNNNSNHLHIDLGHGIVYDGPKKISGQGGDVELLGIKIKEIGYVSGKPRITWNVRGSNVRKYFEGKPAIYYQIVGYDRQGFRTYDHQCIINNDSLQASNECYMPLDTVKVVLEEWY